MPTKKKNKFLLFVFEQKTFIEHQGNEPTNQRDELIFKCRH